MLKLTNPRRATALLIGPLMLMATACSGSTDEPSAGNGVASLNEGAAGAPTPADESAVDDVEAPEDPEDAFALFDACMEEHGFGGVVTVVAGGESGSGGIPIGEAGVQEIDPQDAGGSIDDFDKEAFDEANTACEGHLANLDDGFDLTPEQEAAMEDAQLAFANCMAEQGVEMPEVASSGGYATSVEAGASEFDPQSGELSPDDLDFDLEAFNEASETCDAVFDQLETAQP